MTSLICGHISPKSDTISSSFLALTSTPLVIPVPEVVGIQPRRPVFAFLAVWGSATVALLKLARLHQL